jgi:endoglucanase
LFGQGFLHRNEQEIVDGNGKNVVLSGLGLGGWMVRKGIDLLALKRKGLIMMVLKKEVKTIGEVSLHKIRQ